METLVWAAANTRLISKRKPYAFIEKMWIVQHNFKIMHSYSEYNNSWNKVISHYRSKINITDLSI